MTRSFNTSRATAMLQSAGIRPTRQRTALAAILFDGKPKHVSAEMIFAAARKNRASVSLATVYNNLHEFADAGLLREVMVDHKFRYFDTTVTEHYHYFDEETGCLYDVPERAMRLLRMPKAPSGKKIIRVDVIIRLCKAK